LFKHPKPFASIAAGASLQPARGADARPPLLVLVVGETARADHFVLNGYARDTNPELAKHQQVLSWREATSCGTSTRESVPCMFSHLDRKAFYGSPVQYDGLLDVLQAAGMAVLWVENQAGCKGVCDRTPHVSTGDELNTAAGKRHCDASGECLDGIFVDTTRERLASLPSARATAWCWCCTRWAATAPRTTSARTPRARPSRPSAPPTRCRAARTTSSSTPTTTPSATPTTCWPG
jgi:lipid A ethanolaminephosphotransferase